MKEGWGLARDAAGRNKASKAVRKGTLDMWATHRRDGNTGRSQLPGRKGSWKQTNLDAWRTPHVATKTDGKVPTPNQIVEKASF